MYCTPERFRTMGLGVDLDGFEDVELRSILSRASAMVDAYLKVPLLPVRHDLKGGTVIDEESPYYLPRYFHEPPKRQVYVMHKPIRAVTQMRIYVTNMQFVEIQPSEIFVTRALGRVEIVSLAMSSVGLFGAFIVPNIGLANPICRISYTYGWSFPIVDEVLEATDARTFQAQHQWWDGDADVVVKKNGTQLDLTLDYTVRADEGVVKLVDNPGADDVITASYSHRLLWEIEQATGIVAADQVSRSANLARGLGGLRRITVAEVSLEKDMPRSREGSGAIPRLPPDAELLLDGLDWITIR